MRSIFSLVDTPSEEDWLEERWERLKQNQEQEELRRQIEKLPELESGAFGFEGEKR